MFAKVKGLPKRLATDVLNVYGLSAYEVIKNNPYQLVEMNRIGFVSADKVGMSCGIKPDANERIKAGLLYVMKQHINDSGDIWLKINMISDSLSTLIDGLKAVVVADMIVQMIKDKVLVKRGGFVTFERYDKDETIIADCVGRFLNG
jgi:exodeoxyribonuclease V alpha subunit